MWGISLRDWLAGQAISAVMEKNSGIYSTEEIAEEVYMLADAMHSTGNAVNAPARRRAAMGARAERPVELDLSRSEAVAMISNSM